MRPSEPDSLSKRVTMNRRVVITGIGCISPVGHDPLSAWKRACEGKSAVQTIRRFDATGFPTTIAAEVSDFDVGRWVPAELVPGLAKAGPNITFGLAAAVQAMRDSGLQDKPLTGDPSRFGVYLGSGEGSQDFDMLTRMIMASLDQTERCDFSRFSDLGVQWMDAEYERQQEPNVLVGRIAGLFGAQGPNMNCLTACAASAQAIGEGTEMIREGLADVLITGGAHSMIHPFGLTGFTLLTALSTRNDAPEQASRPFDRERDGFVLGEGAAMLILEEYEHAKRRGAKIYGEVRGYGVASDAYRITDIPVDGNGIARAMQHALRNASLNPEDISYVNAHGTSTGANDKTETRALKTVFGDYAPRLPISSTKGATGHLVAACGALEAVFSLMALRDQVLPPTANYEFPDPECDLDYIPRTARSLPGQVKTVMSNNSGFGGQNVSLIFSGV